MADQARQSGGLVRENITYRNFPVVGLYPLATRNDASGPGTADAVCGGSRSRLHAVAAR